MKIKCKKSLFSDNKLCHCFFLQIDLYFSRKRDCLINLVGIPRMKYLFSIVDTKKQEFDNEKNFFFFNEWKNIVPSFVCDPTSINSLNSPLSLSNEMPFELLFNRSKPGCLGGRPEGVGGNWPCVGIVPGATCTTPPWFWLLKLVTVAVSIILLNSVSWSWLVNLTKDSSFT